jgi:ferredoxin
MSSLKIVHDQKRCIGCNSCVSLAPQCWSMNEETGKAELIGAKKKGNVFVGEIFDCDLDSNKQAAEACPVNIIQIRG